MVDVEVLVVSKTMDLATGVSGVQVLFGEMIPVTTQVQDRFQRVGQQVPVGDFTPHPLLSLLLPASESAPYQVGSKWALDRLDTGELTLKRRT